MKKEIIQIIKTSRPRFWIYLAGPYLVGFLAGATKIEQFFGIEFLSYFLGFLFFGNLIVYGINDIYDAEIDKKNPKKETKETRADGENSDQIKKSIIFGLVYFVFMLLMAKLEVGILLGIFILLAHQYSAPPVRAKIRPILDSSFNFLYVIPGLIGYFQTGANQVNLLLLAGAFCWTFSMHLFSAMVDIRWDREAKIKTTATELGFDGSRKLCFLLWGVFGIISIIQVRDTIGIVAAVYPILALISDENKIERIYWWFPKINVICGFLVFVWIVLEKGWVGI